MAEFLHQNPDHETLSLLARENPEAFENLRQQLVDELIGRAPDLLKRRLLGLQFRIDVVRRRSKNPLGATVKIYHMMWDSFLNLHNELTTFHDPVRVTQGNAQVLNFRPRKHRPAA